MSSVYLVMRREVDEHVTTEVPQLAFADAETAERHARTATEQLGVPHRVLAVTLAPEPPTPQSWHSMCVELQLNGSELWRHEEQLVTFSGHPDEVAEEAATWRVIVRDAPSQPPSRVRITLLGPDRAWCITQARACWAQARASHEFHEASEIEELFSLSRHR